MNSRRTCRTPSALAFVSKPSKACAPPDVFDAKLFNEHQALVLELTDRMTQEVAVPDALMARMNARFNPQEVVELVATIAAYNIVSRFLVALAIAH